MTAQATQIPNHVFSDNSETGTTVLVDKSARSAYLIDIKDNKPRLIRSFDNLLFGENGGDKLFEGDKRTPEGVYRITRFIPDDQLAPIYGSGAFPIDYPNPLDRIEGRNGSGIWLHGRDYDDPEKSTTRGCVAFNNNEIGELSKILSQNTPVIITRHAEFVTEPEYDREREDLLATLGLFLDAWEQGAVDQLREQLHPAFKSQNGMNREHWLDYKRRLDRLYPEKHITADHIDIFKEDGHQVVFNFTQYYCASNILSVGRKQLFYKNENGKLQLLTESFERIPAKPYLEHKVKEFVAGWLDAWQKGDLEAYIGHYSEEFRDGRDRDFTEYRRYKSDLFNQRPRQRISIDDLRLTQLASNRYQVSFRQAYSSDDYSDLGTKTLLLDGCPDDLSILAENWTTLD